MARKGRAAVNPPLLAALVYRAYAGHAFVEFVGARPGEGPVGAFAFGRCRGVVEGVLGAVGVPATQLTPAAWKRAVGIPPRQGRSEGRCSFCGDQTMAQQGWPIRPSKGRWAR